MGGLVVVGVFGDLLDDFTVAVGGGDGALDVSGVEGAFVFELVEGFLAGVGVHALDGFAFLEEDAAHADLGFDGDGLVVHEEALEDSLLDGVAEDRRAKEGGGVGGGGGGEPNFDGIEVVDGVAPDAHFLGGVAAVAFVGDDEVKGVDGDVELVSVGFRLGIATGLGEAALGAEEVAGHALDGGDIDEGMAGPGGGEVFVGEDLGVEGVVVAEVFLLEALAVELVFLGELVALGGVESVELANSLGGEGLAVHQEQDAAGEPAFEEAIDLGDREEGLAGAGGQGKEQLAPAGDEGLLGSDNAAALVVAQADDKVRGRIEEPVVGGLGVAGEEGGQGGRRVEMADGARDRVLGADVEVPDDFAVGGVEEGNTIAVPVARALGGALGIAFGLLEDVLGVYCDLLGFEDAKELTVNKEGVIGGTIGGGELGDSVAVEGREVESGLPRQKLPGRVTLAEPGVNPFLPSLPL